VVVDRGLAAGLRPAFQVLQLRQLDNWIIGKSAISAAHPKTLRKNFGYISGGGGPVCHPNAECLWIDPVEHDWTWRQGQVKQYREWASGCPERRDARVGAVADIALRDVVLGAALQKYATISGGAELPRVLLCCGAGPQLWLSKEARTEADSSEDYNTQEADTTAWLRLRFAERTACICLLQPLRAPSLLCKGIGSNLSKTPPPSI
jgi:hypothetical protein